MSQIFKKISSLFLALTIFFSVAAFAPKAAAANVVRIPISIEIPYAIAGAEIEFEYSSGLTFSEFEKSETVQSAASTPVSVKNGKTKLGFVTASNDYAPTDGKIDIGSLVFQADRTAGETVTITLIHYVRLVDKDTVQSVKLTDPIVVTLSGEGSENPGVDAGGSSQSGGTSGSTSGNTSSNTSSERYVLPFKDVPENRWYYTSVRNAWLNGLIDGMTKTTFAPDAQLTVAQAIKLAAALYQMQTDGTVTLNNGKNGAWYETYVAYAVDHRILEDAYLDYTAAQMNAAVTRAEFVHIFYGALQDTAQLNTVMDGDIPDVRESDLYGSEIYSFYRAGITVGSDVSGTFYPNSSIKRSEAAAILIRMYDTASRQTIRL